MSHFMLVPSTRCPAKCSYCFGPHGSGIPMPDGVLNQAVDWICGHVSDEPLALTFHGGEPLTAGIGFFRRVLPALYQACAGAALRISLQSNLWLLTAEYLDLFEQYQVHLGTSLDGPEEINDAQRGKGYFARTMEKLTAVRRRGLSSGCIATLTALSAPRWPEVVQFFERERLDVSLHAALPGLRSAAIGWALPPDEYGSLMVDIFTVTLAKGSTIRIEPIESMCNGLAAGRAGSCVFGDCLGKFLTVGPDGAVYPCQRFVGYADYRLGNISSCAQAGLKASSAWQELAKWQRDVRQACGPCAFWDICHGGCPYNVRVRGAAALREGLRDPYCPAYQHLFSAILDRAAEEFFSEENLGAVVANPDSPQGLFRHGNLLNRLRLRAPQPG